MNHLQARRQALGLTQPQVARRLKQVEPRVGTPQVSRYERGVCLPTRRQLEVLEETLHAARTELYDPSELDLLPRGPSACAMPRPPVATEDRRSERYLRKCYRLPRDFAATLPPDLWSLCGYASEQSWYDACLKRLLGEYGARKKALERKAGK